MHFSHTPHPDPSPRCGEDHGPDAVGADGRLLPTAPARAHELFVVGVPARPDLKPAKAFGPAAALLAKDWFERECPSEVVQIVPVESFRTALPGHARAGDGPTPAGLPRPWQPSIQRECPYCRRVTRQVKDDRWRDGPHYVCDECCGMTEES